MENNNTTTIEEEDTTPRDNSPDGSVDEKTVHPVDDDDDTNEDQDMENENSEKEQKADDVEGHSDDVQDGGDNNDDNNKNSSSSSVRIMSNDGENVEEEDEDADAEEPDSMDDNTPDENQKSENENEDGETDELIDSKDENEEMEPREKQPNDQEEDRMEHEKEDGNNNDQHESEEDDDDDDDENQSDEEVSDDGDDDNSDSDSDDDSNDNEDGEQISAYERMRQERIKRNQERLASLGLDKPVMTPKREKQSKREKKARLSIEPSDRTSLSRNSKKSVNYADMAPPWIRGKPETTPNEQKRQSNRRSRQNPMDVNVYKEFQRIKSRRRRNLIEAEKNVRKATIELKFVSKKAEIMNRKNMRKQESKKLTFEKKKIARTRREMLQEIDKRTPEIHAAINFFDQTFVSEEELMKREEAQREKARKLQLIDAINRFPKSVKDANRDLNFLLYERSPRDPPPPRRGRRKRKTSLDPKDQLKRRKSESSSGPTKSQTVDVKDIQWKSIVAASLQMVPRTLTKTDTDQETLVQPHDKSKKKFKAKNVGGWQSPEFAENINRSWLNDDKNKSELNYSTFIPQAGDIVLYYPVGHQEFLETFPDIIGGKSRNKTRIPLWERARREKRKSEGTNHAPTVSRSAIDGGLEETLDYKGESLKKTEWWKGQSLKKSEWWNDEWLNGFDAIFCNYPLICRVERTHAEFPPDPEAKYEVVKDNSTGGVQLVFETHLRKKKPSVKTKPILPLAVVLRPLTPLLPPRSDMSDKLTKTSLAPPPLFQVVTFPSTRSPFILPFGPVYTSSHSISVGEKVKSRDSIWKGTVKKFLDLAEEYGSARLDDRKEQISCILAKLKADPKRLSTNLSASLMLNDSNSQVIPYPEACIVLEQLSNLVSEDEVESTTSVDLTLNKCELSNLIRSTLPLWNAVFIVCTDTAKRIFEGAWTLIGSRGAKKSTIRNSLVNSLAGDTVADNGLVYRIEEPLRAKLELTLEDFGKESANYSEFFWAPVTDDDAPSYSCAVPIGMSLSRVLQRLSSKKGKKCYYRSVDALFNDLSTIFENTLLYNSPSSEVVQLGHEMVSAARRQVSEMVRQHNKELSAREKEIDDRRNYIMLQSNSSAVVEKTDVDARRASHLKSGPTSLLPFNAPLHRKWIESIHPDSTWDSSKKGTHESSDPAQNNAWVPQAGDHVLYSRSMHFDFIRGHYDSLTSEQCQLPQFVLASKSPKRESCNNATPDTSQTNGVPTELNTKSLSNGPGAPSKVGGQKKCIDSQSQEVSVEKEVKSLSKEPADPSKGDQQKCKDSQPEEVSAEKEAKSLSKEPTDQQNCRDSQTEEVSVEKEAKLFSKESGALVSGEQKSNQSAAPSDGQKSTNSQTKEISTKQESNQSTAPNKDGDGCKCTDLQSEKVSVEQEVKSPPKEAGAPGELGSHNCTDLRTEEFCTGLDIKSSLDEPKQSKVGLAGNHQLSGRPTSGCEDSINPNENFTKTKIETSRSEAAITAEGICRQENGVEEAIMAEIDNLLGAVPPTKESNQAATNNPPRTVVTTNSPLLNTEEGKEHPESSGEATAKSKQSPRDLAAKGSTASKIETQILTEADLERLLMSKWLVGKIVWVRAVFPLLPARNDSSDSFEDGRSPLLSVGISFSYEWMEPSPVYTVVWRPCSNSATISHNHENKELCAKCQIPKPFGFLRPAWLHQHSGRPILSPLGIEITDEAIFGRPTGIKREDINAIDRCFNVLKRRCLDDISPDSIELGKKQAASSSSKSIRSLPTFGRLLGLEEDLEAERSSDRKLAKDRKWNSKEEYESALPALSRIHYIPPFSKSELERKSQTDLNAKVVAREKLDDIGYQSKPATFEETICAAPKMCLELVQLRLRNGYYRSKAAVVDELQESYVNTSLVVLTKETNRKFGPKLSIRKVAKSLKSQDSNSMRSKKKLEEEEQEGEGEVAHEARWREHIKRVRNLYGTAVVVVAETKYAELALGASPPKLPRASANTGAPEGFAEREKCMKEARTKLLAILTATDRDPCLNRKAKIRLPKPTHIDPNQPAPPKVDPISLFPSVSLKIVGDGLENISSEDSDDVFSGPIVFSPSDYVINEDLIRLWFGRANRMLSCARCEVYGRPLLICRVQRAHSNPDFDWNSQYKNHGGIDGILYMMMNGKPKPVLPSASIQHIDQEQLDSAPIQSPAVLVPNDSLHKSTQPDETDVLNSTLQKAIRTIHSAKELFEYSQRQAAAPLRLGKDFIVSHFPIDPEDGKYAYCTVCGISGDVMCCESAACPVVKHAKCVGLESIPEEDWFCEECVAKKAKPTTEVKQHSTVDQENATKEMVELSEAAFDREKKLVEDSILELKYARNPGLKEREDDERKRTAESKETQEGTRVLPDQTAVTENEEPTTPSRPEAEDSKKRKREPSPTITYARGTNFRKHFDSHGIFNGVVVEVPTKLFPYYFVHYENGDEEDLIESELTALVENPVSNPVPSLQSNLADAISQESSSPKEEPSADLGSTKDLSSNSVGNDLGGNEPTVEPKNEPPPDTQPTVVSETKTQNPKERKNASKRPSKKVPRTGLRRSTRGAAAAPKEEKKTKPGKSESQTDTVEPTQKRGRARKARKRYLEES